MMQQARLNNQVALVSGGLGDIGYAIAAQLMEQGAAVALCDVFENDEASHRLATLKQAMAARYDRVDVTDATAVERWVAAVADDLGPPSIIIPNAATVTVADPLRMTPEQWSRELAVNLSGAFYLAQAGARCMKRHMIAGTIVFIGSWAAQTPHPHLPAYSVTKAGLRMLCQCLALELAGDGITVNEVAPGYVDAGLSARMFQERPGARETAEAQVPTGRLIASHEVARQVGYLCSEASRQMTGSTLLLDGGLSLTAAHRPTRERA